MRKDLSLRSLTLFFLITFFLLCSTFYSCNAGRSKHFKQTRIFSKYSSKEILRSSDSNYIDGTNPSSPITLAQPMKGDGGGQSTVFNVLDFGAKGDGETDDTEAFRHTWRAACKVKESRVLVPSDYTFMVGPIRFLDRRCQPNIIFQLDGTIIAPEGARAWGSGKSEWIKFKNLRGIMIRGRGTIDGHGQIWWAQLEFDDSIGADLHRRMPLTRPTALKFHSCSNVTVTGITIQNSPKYHLNFNNCAGVNVFNLTVSSPSDSPNTDGIHLQNTQDVLIYNTNLACGDDCVSIQTGCTNVNIHDVYCGPGHGISIGGLGKDGTKACVSNITVHDIILHNTMTGVRIKTWQGGSGSVQGVLFSDIQVFKVRHPIVIDQFYCDGEKCTNQTAAVALSNINFKKITGTYTSKPVHLACSDTSPCTNITLTGIELHHFQKGHKMSNPFCWQAYGELLTPSIPPIECLQPGEPGNWVPSSSYLC